MPTIVNNTLKMEAHTWNNLLESDDDHCMLSHLFYAPQVFYARNWIRKIVSSFSSFGFSFLDVAEEREQIIFSRPKQLMTRLPHLMNISF